MALANCIDRIERVRRDLVTRIVLADAGEDQVAVASWLSRRGAQDSRIRAALADIATGGATLSKLVVAASLLDDPVGD
jgi:NAD-specific glutamate dehydrogenase